MAVVETVKLSKHFNDVKAVDGIDITIQEGEFLVLLGPSGSGKTTLMRMIAGLEKPTGGTIKIGDRVVNDLPPRLRNVAMVFQSYALYPHMSVYNNIAFSLRPLGMTRQQIDDKVHWAARMFSIDHLLSRKPRQLSGGQRQRVALARAIVREPDVFLLDEPLSNLDAKLRAMARDELKQFQRQLGVTTIYVTHDQVEAMGMGDRVAVMSNGRMHQLGTPQVLYQSPADTFVATFLGTPPMNLVETDSCLLGFRPENFLPEAAHPDTPHPLVIDFHLTRVEFLGSDRLLYGTIEGADGPVKVVGDLPSVIDYTPEPGTICPMMVDRRHLSYFDKSTGQRIAPTPFALRGLRDPAGTA
ncbi:MAG: ABC transporter ATP-binding protein [Chloroflexi bacterium]|nr:MAG: ABC transporter related protein [Chloroflexi bacterium OLB13]MBC6955600.1 ABC transporter ATP-binding protein [Chloroflexota bacterium]MBV6437210.1 sn-glycerol-3-phosphate import ATP-binding protein UgpC [Anaerolineae bacterium]MDL1914906.1 ABC transporter ATP-binding protein [Anaerolineae bacterium CFX4]OQY85407.1 MAG: ABC transporter [Anaerolineae bacterium UTCFX5]